MAQNKVLDARTEDLGSADLDGAVDPFALDFFAQSSTEDEEAEQTIRVENPVVDSSEYVWFESVPKLSAAEARRIKISSELPALFSENILPLMARTLSDCVANKTAEAVCQIVVSEETNLQIAAEALIDENAVFVSFTAEPGKQQAALVLDTLFATEIISKSFGDEPERENRRQLSANEMAVLEFFALCCLNKTNKFLNEPLFRLHAAGHNLPTWLQPDATDFEKDATTGLLVKIKLLVGDSAGLIQLFAPYQLLESLSEKSNLLLINRDRRRQNARLAKTVSGISLKVLAGETAINASDLLILEPNDIILIERPMVVLAENTLRGNVAVRIGDDNRESLHGTLNAMDQSLLLEVNEINQKSRFDDSTRLKMQENEDESNDFNAAAQSDADGGSVALDKVVVTLYVQIASRRVSLEELAAMRVGQIIELGAKPTDPVELVTDNKTIAIGELVNTEDNLGVRLKRVLL